MIGNNQTWQGLVSVLSNYTSLRAGIPSFNQLSTAVHGLNQQVPSMIEMMCTILVWSCGSSTVGYPDHHSGWCGCHTCP
eukprot:8898950-Ditylum_brightwellii.AAC.1